MIGIGAFIQRNPRLSRDEYAAAHAGFHGSLGRRLENMRGYVFNTWLEGEPDPAWRDATRGEPAGFFDLWDGFSELYFADAHDPSGMRSSVDRATPAGAVSEDLTDALYEDGGNLCARGGFHFGIDERVISPVWRPERPQVKVQQWGRRRAEIPEREFVERWTAEYAPLYRGTEGLHGHVLFFRGKEEDEELGSSWEGEERPMDYSDEAMRQFFDLWDGFGFLHLEDPSDFGRQRERGGSALTTLENELFESIWYREVREVIVVMPDRQS